MQGVMRRVAATLLLSGLICSISAVAFAFDESYPGYTGFGNCSCHVAPGGLATVDPANGLHGYAGLTGPGISGPTVAGNCSKCHSFYPDNTNVWAYGGGTWGPDDDDAPDFPFNGVYSMRGPHGMYTGAYTTGTRRCEMCHTLHAAPTGFKLLPGETVKATCFTCHDGTAGHGVYGTMAARGVTVGSGHSVETTNVVPGGSAATGGNATMAFRGPGGTLTCSDCHSPHDSNTVAPFQGERLRIGAEQPVYSTKLLKRMSTPASSSVGVYGSDWCLGCHKGRASGGGIMNHPVESAATTSSPYTYSRLPVYSTTDEVAYASGVPVRTQTVLLRAVGNLNAYTYGSPKQHLQWGDQPASSLWEEGGARNTSPWLMAMPRSALHAGHFPICQQCHEDSREAGELSVDGTAALIVGDKLTKHTIDGHTSDGDMASFAPPNPRFQNFPHETQNANMLVETDDDLCANCHPPAVLP